MIAQNNNEKAEYDMVILKCTILSMQVCVPEDSTDEAVVDFANANNPSGTRSGWHIRRAGDELLQSSPERIPCDRDEGQVHIMLDC